MKKILIILIILLFSFSVFAFKIPEKPKNYMNDFAGIFSYSQQQKLNKTLYKFEKQTSIQIFIAVFNSLEGENLEDFSIRLAEKWKPGQKNKDNGVLISLFMKDKKVRIEVGYGLESVLTDAISNIIIQKEIVPKFKKRQYYSGLYNTVKKVMLITSGEMKPQQIKKYRKNKKPKAGILDLIFMVLFVGGFIFFAIKHPFLALLLFNGGGFSSGGRYSSGGFGGGGGGSFGGGGASGGW